MQIFSRPTTVLRVLAMLFLSAVIAAQAANWTTDVDDYWSTPGRWSTGVPNDVDAVAALDVSGGIAANRIVTLDQNATVGTLTLNDSSSPYNSWTVAQGGSYGLTFDVSSGSAAMTVTRGDANAIAVPLTLNDNLNLTVSNSSKVTLGGNIDGAGQLKITGSGSNKGTVRLAGTNTFSGGLHLHYGTLEFTSAAALGGGAIEFGNPTISDMLYFKNDSGDTVTISNDFKAASGSTRWNHLYLQGGNFIFEGDFDTAGDTGGQSIYVDAAVVTLNNGIGENHVYKTGSTSASGQLNLMAPSNGGTVTGMNGGRLGLGVDGALGSGTNFSFGAWGGTFEAIGGDRTIDKNLSATWLTIGFDGGTNGHKFLLSGDANFTGGGIEFNVPGTGTLTMTGNLNGGVQYFRKQGTGGMILTSDNSTTLSGPVTLGGGTLAVGHDSALGTGTLTVPAAGAAKTLRAHGGARTLANDLTITTGTLTVDGNHNLTIAGTVTTSSSVIQKYGSGTLTLTNPGNTLVSTPLRIYEGMVVAGHADAMGTSDNTVRVFEGGTFAVGSGVVFSRAVTFDAGSGLGGDGTLVRGGAWSLPANITLAPGFSTGMLTIDVGAGNTLAMNGTTTTEIEIAGLNDHDTLRILGVAALAGNLDIVLLDGHLPAFGTTFDVITATGGLSGEINLAGAYASWFTAAIVDGNTLQLTSQIPEPASALLLALAGLAMFRRSKRG